MEREIHIETGYQTIKIVKAIGSPAGATTEKVQLNQDYDRCTGIALVEVTDGNLPGGHYDVGIHDERETYINSIGKSMLKVGDQTPQDQRYLSITIPIKSGTETKILTSLPDIPTADVEFNLIFRLEREVVS